MPHCHSLTGSSPGRQVPACPHNQRASSGSFFSCVPTLLDAASRSHHRRNATPQPIPRTPQPQPVQERTHNARQHKAPREFVRVIGSKSQVVGLPSGPQLLCSSSCCCCCCFLQAAAALPKLSPVGCLHGPPFTPPSRGPGHSPLPIDENPSCVSLEVVRARTPTPSPLLLHP